MKTRRTTMLFAVGPPWIRAHGWRFYVERFKHDIILSLWCRARRKSQGDLVNARVEMRQLKAKWYDPFGTTGVVEATMIWDETNTKG